MRTGCSFRGCGTRPAGSDSPRLSRNTPHASGNRGFSSMKSKTLSPGALLVAPTSREQSVENRWLLGNREATTVAGDVRGIREGARTVRARRASSAAPEGMPRASPAELCARAGRQKARRGEPRRAFRLQIRLGGKSRTVPYSRFPINSSHSPWSRIPRYTPK